MCWRRRATPSSESSFPPSAHPSSVGALSREDVLRHNARVLRDEPTPVGYILDERPPVDIDAVALGTLDPPAATGATEGQQS